MFYFRKRVWSRVQDIALRLNVGTLLAPVSQVCTPCVVERGGSSSPPTPVSIPALVLYPCSTLGSTLGKHFKLAKFFFQGVLMHNSVSCVFTPYLLPNEYKIYRVCLSNTCLSVCLSNTCLSVCLIHVCLSSTCLSVCLIHVCLSV